jgi:CRP-like cAMP-binding protein
MMSNLQTSPVKKVRPVQNVTSDGKPIPGIPELIKNDLLEVKYGRQKYRPIVQSDPRFGIVSPLKRVTTAQAKKTTAVYKRSDMFPKWLVKDDDFKRIFKTKYLPEDVGIRKPPDSRTDKNLRDMGSWFNTHILFKRFSLSRCKEIARIAMSKVLMRNEEFASHADTRNHLYIVHQGEVAIRSPTLGILGILKPGDSIGYVEGTPATYQMAKNHAGEFNVKLSATKASTRVVIIKRSEYKSRMRIFQENEIFKNMKFFEKHVKLFSEWTLGRILVFAKQVEEWNVPKGDFVVRQGEDSDKIFFVRAGFCAIQKRVKYKKTNTIPTPTGFTYKEVTVDKSVEVLKCGVGDFFGHQSMLDGAASYITGVALTNVQLLVASKDFAFAMFGFRGTMEKLRKDAKRFLTDPQIIETLEYLVKRKIMYKEAVSHVQMQGHVKDDSTIMKFEDAIPQPLAHTVHGKERFDGGILGHHFDIHKAVSYKKAEKLEAERKRRIKIMSGEISFDLSQRMKDWGKKGKKLHRRKSMIAFRENKKSIERRGSAGQIDTKKLELPPAEKKNPIKENLFRKKTRKKSSRLRRRNSVM